MQARAGLVDLGKVIPSRQLRCRPSIDMASASSIARRRIASTLAPSSQWQSSARSSSGVRQELVQRWTELPGRHRQPGHDAEQLCGNRRAKRQQAASAEPRLPASPRAMIIEDVADALGVEEQVLGARRRSPRRRTPRQLPRPAGSPRRCGCRAGGWRRPTHASRWRNRSDMAGSTHGELNRCRHLAGCCSSKVAMASPPRAVPAAGRQYRARCSRR